MDDRDVRHPHLHHGRPLRANCSPATPPLSMGVPGMAVSLRYSPGDLRCTHMDPKRYRVASLSEIPPVECPCGQTRRAFAESTEGPASIHLVDIRSDARTHYHKKLTEIYLILEGHGELELDGERIPVGPMSTILIQPGCRHRAIGQMKIVNIPIPAFDPVDEWFD